MDAGDVRDRSAWRPDAATARNLRASAPGLLGNTPKLYAIIWRKRPKR